MTAARNPSIRTSVGFHSAAGPRPNNQDFAGAVFGANTSLGEAGIRSSYAIFQANRKASGAVFGEADINAEYDTAMALAQKQFDLAACRDNQ